MSNNRKEATLKSSIAEFIGPLLKRLDELAKDIFPDNKDGAETINNIIREVENTKDSFDSIQNRDRVLIGLFGKIERQINTRIDYDEKWDKTKESNLMTELNDIHSKLLQISTVNVPDLPKEGKQKPTKVPEPSKKSCQENELSKDLKDLEDLDVCSILCLYSLGVFLESTELEKRFVIYWWIGLGLLPQTSWKEAKKRGNEIYSHLKKKGFLKSVHTENCDEVINRCTINPTVHEWLLPPNKDNVIFSCDQRKHFSSPFFGDWFNERVLVNLNKKYLNSSNINIGGSTWQVVQLGSWCYTERKVDNKANDIGPEETMSIDHIEIDNMNVVLKNLGKNTTYLSLRGISGIEEIYESIGKLENLMILDLRSCHNLIKLPHKLRSTLKQKLLGWKLAQQSRLKKLFGWVLPQEGWFNKLMVLDISGCYLLDHMPKWICELSNLEVLKGFVVGSMGTKSRSCQLGELSKLKNLKKLSIRTAIDFLSPEVFGDFNSLESLLILTITWGEHKNQKIPIYSLPKNIEKLDMRCYPEAEASKLQNSEELKNLRRLYIRGGHLKKIPCHDNWKVEILRLRFLKKLDPTDWNEIRSSFKYLKYVEYVGCPKSMNFPNKDGSSWSQEELVIE